MTLWQMAEYLACSMETRQVNEIAERLLGAHFARWKELTKELSWGAGCFELVAKLHGVREALQAKIDDHRFAALLEQEKDRNGCNNT